MVKDIIIEIPLVDQNKDVKENKWKRKSCAICSLKMMMAFSNGKNIEIPIGVLINRAFKMGGYLKGSGWGHKVISDLARNYGIKLRFLKKFLSSTVKKTKWLAKIEKSIMKGNPVMASIFYKLDSKKGGHVVIVNGVRKKGKLTLGYHIQDPDSFFRGNRYFLSREEFLKGWRGGMIWFSK